MVFKNVLNKMSIMIVNYNSLYANIADSVPGVTRMRVLLATL